ncbi:hypothetical protein M569_07637, partial [Genlisea aurea]
LLPLFLLFDVLCSFVFRHNKLEERNGLHGKAVLITGASSGIGEYMAYEYAKRGASLALVARREDRLQKVGAKARCFGSPDVLVICGDVSSFDDCRKFVNTTVNHFGRLDHLVNNAGIFNFYSVNWGVEITKFSPVMDTNFWGSVYPTYFAMPHLKKTRGKIVVNSSVAATVHIPTLAFYCASKAALWSFYEALRAEVEPEVGITIATLGFVESEMSDGKVMSKEGKMNDGVRIPQVVRETIMGTEACARAIVGGACRGRRRVTEPQWFKVLAMANYLFPDILQWVFTFFVDMGP